MAVVSPMPATPHPQRASSSRWPRDVEVPRMMSSITEIVEEPNPNVVDDTIYVAVAKDVNDSKLNLIWAVNNFKGKKIRILHVHVPAALIRLSKFATYVPIFLYISDRGKYDILYDQLEQDMAEADNANWVTFHETIKRLKAEKEAINAIRRKSSLESQVSSTELKVKELEEKILFAVDLLQNYKNERDNALREVEELRRKQGESSGTHVLQFFSEFPFLEIQEATSNFNPSLKIGEGGYGSIFKGILRHTEVAIKVLHPDSRQGPSEFQQEVDVLSKIRHPNLITLIGACPKSCILIYEYLPNGSLEDRLCCKDNTPPLSWQARIRIAAELCSALIFLHSSKPHSIVHGDLKPSNVLLDANLVSKLSDFGICRILSCCNSSSNSTTQFLITEPKGTFAYMDPEFLASRELTTKSDVYAFGIILLRLLTRGSALGIANNVKYALDTGKLKSLLDPSAGDWPFVQAEQLTRLALWCCEMNRKSRPDLCSDVWKMLESMRASFGGTNIFGLD
ncbi:hypothetical protein RIF29_15498 [Crotalaria pallida]|uniref:RING-type E3 ubiquitin transferase n=1 Tax=Crotalaria pallida TaxID=3830 RepID=A0AAN9FDM5_CROPI